MVELLTDYTTQIYHALSTDARPVADPGDQLREIDTGKRFIFDGTSWLELPDGGGGLPTEKLLASGDFTIASAATTASIPVDVPNNWTRAYVVKDTLTGSATFTGMWYRLSTLLVPDIDPSSDYGLLSMAHNYNANGSIMTNYGKNGFLWNNMTYPLIKVADTTEIALRSFSGAVQILPDTYHWYIWGYET